MRARCSSVVQRSVCAQERDEQNPALGSIHGGDVSRLRLGDVCATRHRELRIVPGFTAGSPLDAYYMPYSHSLIAALICSGVAASIYRVAWRVRASKAAALLVGLADAVALASRFRRASA